ERCETRTAQKQRHGHVAFVVWVRVHQQRNSQRVEYFDGGHVYASADDATHVKRKEVQVIVRMKCVAIELDVPFDLEMLSGFEQRPRRRREAHAADVEVRKPSAPLVENVIDP